RGALDAPSLGGCRHLTRQRLPASGNDPAVHYDGLLEGCGHAIADLILVAGKELIHADCEDCARRDRQRGRKRSGRLGILLLVGVYGLWRTRSSAAIRRSRRLLGSLIGLRLLAFRCALIVALLLLVLLG